MQLVAADAEPAELDGLAVLEGLGDEIKGALDEAGAILPRQTNLFVDSLAKVRPRQCRALHVTPVPSQLSKVHAANVASSQRLPGLWRRIA